MSRREGQDAVFYEEEGDHWFQRNADGLGSARSDDLVLSALAGLLVPSPTDVLEVGAANGFRLATIHAEHGSRCLAVEPSLEAIKNGRELFPGIEFRRGLASEIPVELGEQFDLVIVSFVLHWVDRSSLGITVGSIDSCVREGGLLVVSDFLPDVPTCNPYHHRADSTCTYKQDYSGCFTSLNTYESILNVVSAHGDDGGNRSESDRRVSTHVLKKNLHGLYEGKPR